MKFMHHQLQQTNAAIWMAIGVVAIVVASAAMLGLVEIAWRSFLNPAIVAVLLTAGGWYYHSVRSERRLGAILVSTAQIICFAAVGAPLSYIAAMSGFPLQDAMFDAWDRQLNFDWLQMMQFIAAHPALQLVLHFAYASFALQSVTTIMALGIAGQLDRLAGFVAAFVCTTLVTIAVSAVYPAAGPWLFLDMQPAAANGFLPASSTSWPVFLGLRDGTFHTIFGLNAEGIITFPSLHAALGILFPLALWRIPVVRWFAFGLNGLMLVATPAYGSHYVVDVIAGVIVAVACWAAVTRLVSANADANRKHFTAIGDSPSIVPEAVSEPDIAKLSRQRESA
jgi:membrane-associated phospholipid phosphatase